MSQRLYGTEVFLVSVFAIMLYKRSALGDPHLVSIASALWGKPVLSSAGEARARRKEPWGAGGRPGAAEVTPTPTPTHGTGGIGGITHHRVCFQLFSFVQLEKIGRGEEGGRGGSRNGWSKEWGNQERVRKEWALRKEEEEEGRREGRKSETELEIEREIDRYGEIYSEIEREKVMLYESPSSLVFPASTFYQPKTGFLVRDNQCHHNKKKLLKYANIYKERLSTMQKMRFSF